MISWGFYDWANSAFTTVIITFIFSAYFTKGIAADTISGTEMWGYAISISAVFIAIAAPVLGAIADRAGRRKPWIFAFTVICVAATALLWFAAPDTANVIWVLAIVVVANFAFEMGIVFYNAMLPDLATKGRFGRLSGWSWGFGYFGGLSCLTVALLGMVMTENPWFGLDKEASEHLRAMGPLVALWFGVFSIPLFLFTPDAPATGIGAARAVREGLASIVDTLKRVRDHKIVMKFLIARMIYTDGINTLFAFGGIYAVGTFDMSFQELMIFGIGMNVTAGIGAFTFGWVDDWIGPKRTIQIALALLVVFGTLVLLVETKTMFWVFGLPLGLFVGPAQAASRTMMANLAPPRLRTEMFGLYALSGKATAFLGPALFAYLTAVSGSQRVGMASVVVFFVVGSALLYGVHAPHHASGDTDPSS